MLVFHKKKASQNGLQRASHLRMENSPRRQDKEDVSVSFHPEQRGGSFRLKLASAEENEYQLFEEQRNMNITLSDYTFHDHLQRYQTKHVLIKPSANAEDNYIRPQRRSQLRSRASFTTGLSNGPLVYTEGKYESEKITHNSESYPRKHKSEESIFDDMLGKRASRHACQRKSDLVSSKFALDKDLDTINSVPGEEAFDGSLCLSRNRVTMVPCPPTEYARIRYRGHERSRSSPSFNLRKPDDHLVVTAGECVEKEIKCSREILAGQNIMGEVAMQINSSRKASRHEHQRKSHFMPSISTFCENEENSKDEENNSDREDWICTKGAAASPDIKPIRKSLAVESGGFKPRKYSTNKEEQDSFKTEKGRTPKSSSHDLKIPSHNPTSSGKQLFHSHNSNSSSKAELPPIEEPIGTEGDAPKSTQTKCRRQAVCIELEKTMNLVKLNGTRMSLYDLRKDICRLVHDRVFKEIHEEKEEC